MTYLKAVEAAKSVDADKVMAAWRAMKMNDFYDFSGTLRSPMAAMCTTCTCCK
jgi:branched-chain amino acid transport system substrate-binding protein